jgi:hypothetical protein
MLKTAGTAFDSLLPPSVEVKMSGAIPPRPLCLHDLNRAHSTFIFLLQRAN